MKIIKIQKSKLTTGVTITYEKNGSIWTVTYLNPPDNLRLALNC